MPGDVGGQPLRLLGGDPLERRGGILGQSPQNRHALGSRERGVEAPRRPVPEPPAQSAVVGRVAGLEQPTQLLRQDRATRSEPESGTAGAPPPARRLVRVEVVVHRATSPAAAAVELVGGEPGVVAKHLPDPVPGRLDGHDAGHHQDPARPCALVCSWKASMPY